MRYLYIPFRMAKTLRVTSATVDRDVHSCTAGGRDQHFGKLNIGIPYYPVTPPLVTHPTEMCIHIH